MKTIHNVQLLRAVAAYMVVGHHILHGLHNRHGVSKELTLGAAGVDIFFVISGFIMVYTTSTRALKPWTFLTNRAVRIYPMYWCILAVVVALSLAGLRPVGLQAWDNGDLISSILLVPNERADGQPTPLLTVAWTLVYEMFFYLVFAVSLGLKASARARVVLISGLFVLFCAVHVVLKPTAFAAQVYTNPLLLEFCAGCWLGLLYPRLKTWSKGNLRALGTGALVLGLLGFAYSAATHGHVLHKFTSGMARATWFGIPAALVILAVLALEQGGLAFRHREVIRQGDASYSTYLIHHLLVHIVLKAMSRLGEAGALWLIVASSLVTFVVSGFAGTLLHLYLEKPLGQFMRRATSPRAPAVST